MKASLLSDHSEDVELMPSPKPNATPQQQLFASAGSVTTPDRRGHTGVPRSPSRCR